MEYNIEFIIDEMMKIVQDNLLLFLNNDEYLTELKHYCKKAHNIVYTPYDDLIYFLMEALCDLVRAEYLYDFREIE